MFLLDAHITVTNSDGYGPNGLVIPAGGSPITALYPKLSPNATVVAYQTRNPTTSPAKIRIVSTGCTLGNQMVTSLCAGFHHAGQLKQLSNLYPAWHPALQTITGKLKGGKIVFVRKQNFGDTTADIFVTDIVFAPNGSGSEGSTTKLTNNPANYLFPAVSPDGQYTSARMRDSG